MRSPKEITVGWRRCGAVLVFLFAVLVGTALLLTEATGVCAAKKKKTKDITIKWLNVGKTVTLNTSSGSKTLNVKVTPKKYGKKLVWKSGKPSVAVVSSKGKLTIKKPGITTITCYIKGHKKKKVTCSVRVKPVLVTSVQLKAKDPVVQVGETYKGGTSVKVFPKNAYNRRVKFTSSNKSVAKVDASTGVVIGKKEGKATITCKARDGSKKKETYKITVVGKITVGSTKFIAHRGYSDAAPANTQRAYILAGQNGFWGCEGDVWKTRDGHFIMYHDKNFEEGCGVDNKASSMTLDQIRKLKIKTGNNYKKYKKDPLATTIPTFEEYLKICKEYEMVPVVDIKMKYSPDEPGSNKNQRKAKKDMKALYDIAVEIMGDSEIKFIAFDIETLIQLQTVIDEARNAAEAEMIRLELVKAEKKAAEESSKESKKAPQTADGSTKAEDGLSADGLGKEEDGKLADDEEADNSDRGETSDGKETDDLDNGEISDGKETEDPYDLTPKVPIVLPRVTIQHCTKKPDINMINFYCSKGIELSAKKSELSVEDLNSFQEAGIVVDVWTVDDEEDTWKWIKREVDFITTDKAFWL